VYIVEWKISDSGLRETKENARPRSRRRGGSCTWDDAGADRLVLTRVERRFGMERGVELPRGDAVGGAGVGAE